MRFHPCSLARAAAILAAAVLPFASSACFSQPSEPVDPSLLWDEGTPFTEFLSEAENRVETWQSNYGLGPAADELLAKAREIPGAYRLLVVAEDWCGDSANTVPHVARLEDSLDNLEMRIVRSGPGRGIQATHLTPDGRTSTPTFILLNEVGDEVGCLVEQPPELQEWWLGEAQEIAEEDARYGQKYAWYAEDAGRSTQAAIVELMDAASRGEVICRANGI